MNFEIGHYYEFIGSVQNDLSLRVLGATDFGTDIGMIFVIFRHWFLHLHF